VSAKPEIISLDAPVAEPALDQLADVLVDCVEGGASVSFMSPFSHAEAFGFFRKVAGSVASGDTVLLAARQDGRIVGTVQLGLDTPPNQPHRADIKKLLVHRSARGHGVGAALMAQVEEEARRRGRWLLVLSALRAVPTTTNNGNSPAYVQRGGHASLCPPLPLTTVSAFPLVPLPSPASPACG
jgi:GNAT superfamily N-acetyltransferase